MSRILALGAILVISITSAATALAGPTTASSGRTIGYTPSSVFVRKVEAPTTPVCSLRDYDRTTYSARPYCPDFGETRQFFVSGQVIPAGFGQPVGYAQLSSALRAEYRLNPERDYVFAAGYLYDIDHQSKAIQRVIPVELAR